MVPATAVVVALVVLAWSMQRIETEVVALRVALRRSRRAAVATDELERLTGTVAERAAVVDRTRRARRDLRRDRRRSGRR